MNIIVNSEPTSFSGSTVADLAEELQLPAKGVAIARGMQMIPRDEWETTLINDNDSFIIIRAAYGG